jgi:hypothetical protein
MGGVLAYVELAAAIIFDEVKQSTGAEMGTPASSACDLSYEVRLLASVRNWLNERDIAKMATAERAKG